MKIDPEFNVRGEKLMTISDASTRSKIAKFAQKFKSLFKQDAVYAIVPYVTSSGSHLTMEKRIRERSIIYNNFNEFEKRYPRYVAVGIKRRQAQSFLCDFLSTNTFCFVQVATSEIVGFVDMNITNFAKGRALSFSNFWFTEAARILYGAFTRPWSNDLSRLMDTVLHQFKETDSSIITWMAYVPASVDIGHEPYELARAYENNNCFVYEYHFDHILSIDDVINKKDEFPRLRVQQVHKGDAEYLSPNALEYFVEANNYFIGVGNKINKKFHMDMIEPITKENIGEILLDSADECNSLLVFFDGNEIVGHIEYNTFKQEYISLNELYVFRHHRNQGYGTRIMKEFLHFAAFMPVKTPYVQVCTFNNGPLGFYNKFYFNLREMLIIRIR